MPRKSYIYISGQGADPKANGRLNDPILKGRPSLGACMPNIRRLVERGDYIFVISGKTEGVQQYVVGGFEVAEKIDTLAAYNRFPENRLRLNEDGILEGNIIVNADGSKHALDKHDTGTFDNRVKNWIHGTNPVALESDREVEIGRMQTLDKLSTILNKPKANRIIDMMGRWAKMNDAQTADMLTWLKGIKAVT